MKRPNNFNDLLDIARNRPDVVGALYRLGYELKRSGNAMGGDRYCTVKKSGISGDFSAVAFVHKPSGEWVIFDNKQRNGKKSYDAIGFLQEMFNLSFDDAVYTLSGGAPASPVEKPIKTKAPTPAPQKAYEPPKPAPNKIKNVMAYLIKTRGLPPSLVSALIKDGKIYAGYYESKEDPTKKILLCAFPIFDEKGNNVGCDGCAPTSNVKFKHMSESSDSRYAWCFNYGINEVKPDTSVFYCEAPIDAMSLCALTGEKGIYVSMCGVKDSTFESMNAKLGGTPVICVDNDEAGNNFAARHPGVMRMSATYGKDFNEDLKVCIERGLPYAISGEARTESQDSEAHVALDDNDVAGHVVHVDAESGEIDPKKENGAPDEGASVENYLAETTDGRLVAVINTDILNGIDTSTWDRETEEAIKKAASQELKKFGQGIVVNSLTITINKTSRREFTRSNYTNALYRRSPEDFSNKMRAAAAIDNILISTRSLNSDGGLKKTRSDDFIDFHRGKVLLCIKESKYEAEVLVGETKKGNFIFYDLLEIQDSNFILKISEKEKILPTVTPQDAFVDIPKDLSINSIPEKFEKVNTFPKENSNSLNDTVPTSSSGGEKKGQEQLRAELEARLGDVVAAYQTDPRALAEYVLFSSRFNHYSARNLRLIWTQNPNARYVASFSEFKKGLPDKNGVPTLEPISVKKGERAMYIYKPYEKLYVTLPDGSLKPKAWLTDSERELARSEGWKEVKSLKYTLVPVFDIAQTNAPPEAYPRLCGLGGERDVQADKAFEALANYSKYALNCPVEVCDFGSRKATVRGSFYPGSNEIKISDMLEGKNKLSTLIHEIGHAELHADSYKNSSKSTAQIELEADMYALMIEGRLGIEPTEARCEHLKSHYNAYIEELKSNATDSHTFDASSDITVMNDVIERFREREELIEAYLNNVDAVERQVDSTPINTSAHSKKLGIRR